MFLIIEGNAEIYVNLENNKQKVIKLLGVRYFFLV